MFAASKTSRAAAAAAADPFFNNVTFLLNTSGTNGAQNNTFVDSSTNNVTMTRNGNATQGSFSPYGEDWSNYFDGSGDDLSTPTSAAFNLGEGNFTIEMWVNLDVTNVQGQYFFFCTGFNPNMFLWDNGVIYLRTAETSGEIVTPTASGIVAGRWTHVACVRSGNTYSIYINGNLLVSGSSTGVTSVDKQITFGRNVRGYISNWRLVKGQALYTSNFTPSTVPLQPIAGTSLLTCKDPNIVDDSANQFTVTRSGDVSAQKYGPFAGTPPATPYFGGYFDGNGDVLTLASNVALAFATGDFTLEMWYYTTVTPTATNVCLYNTGSGNFFIQLRSTAFGIGVVGSAENNAFSASFVANQWYHIAVSRSGSTVRGFVNGTLVGTGSNSVNYGQSGATIGGLTSASQLITGHISNLRVVKGQALYTTSFTPSTEPLTTTSQGAIAGNVSLLTLQSNRLIDNSLNNFTVTAVGNTRPTAFAPFTIAYTSLQPYTPALFGGSLYFGNTSSYAIATMNGGDTFGTGDFTVELWLYPLNSAINLSFPSSNTNSWGMLTFSNQLYWQENGGNLGGAGYGTVVQGSWNHLAVCRSSSTIRWFVNGVQVNSAANTFNYSGAPTNRSIGPRDGGGSPGYISGFRILKGTGLYRSSFVPQNSPPQPVTNTALLFNATNAGIYDAAGLNDFETVGNAQVSTSVKRYGTGSVAFDNDGDRLVIPYNRFFSQTGRYTVEFWFYPYYNFSGQYIFARNAGNYFCLNWNGSTTRMNVDQQAVGIRINGSISMPLNQWHYFAMTYDGTTTRTFANGVLDGSFNGTGGEASGPTTIGFYDAIGTSSFGGYISDFRFTLGVARYTTNFTPPTAALPIF